MAYDQDYATLLVPQPGRQVEIPRSHEDDLSRSAVVDQLRIKHGLVFGPRRRGTPGRMAVSIAHHGTVRSVTFHHLGGRA